MIKGKLEKYINQLKAEGTITAGELIFDEFNRYAENLNLEVAFSTFKESKISHSAVQLENGKSQRVSTISIFLKTTENLEKNNINPLNSNWDSEFNHTKELISKWNELLDKYSFPQNYKSDPTLIFIYSLETRAIVSLVCLCRDNIIEWIKKEKFISKPEYIFCSSEPAYNIVFANKHEFEKSRETTQRELTIYIHQILKKEDIFNYYKEGKVQINMLHKDMEGINLYGLSRQD